MIGVCCSFIGCVWVGIWVAAPHPHREDGAVRGEGNGLGDGAGGGAFHDLMCIIRCVLLRFRVCVCVGVR